MYTEVKLSVMELKVDLEYFSIVTISLQFELGTWRKL